MEKTTLIVGTNDYLKQRRINELSQKAENLDYERHVFDAAENKLAEILNEINTQSLFNPNKLIVVKNAHLFEKDAKFASELLAYIKKPHDGVALVLVSEQITLFELLLEGLNLHAFIETIDNPSEDELLKMVHDSFVNDGYEIDQLAIKELISNKKGDLFAIDSDIFKLKTLSFDTKLVTLADILENTVKNHDDNIYDFASALFGRNTAKIYELLKTFDDQGFVPREIVNNIFYRIVEIKYIKQMLKLKKSKDEIAKFFNVSSGRVYYMMKNADLVSDRYVSNAINDLVILNYQIRTYTIDPKIGLEVFILRRI